MTSQILTIRRILVVYLQKNLNATILFDDFSKVFDAIPRRKMEQILLAYDLPKETIAAIMMLYKNVKVDFRSPDGDTDYFGIVAGVTARRHISPIPVFFICLDYVLKTSMNEK